MPLILCIETATESCSVAIGDISQVIAERTETGKNLHASRLNVLIQETLSDAGLAIRALDAISVSKGPGSYTGLRIGVSAAKGIAYALGIPLLSMNTLHSMAWGAREATGFEGLYCPMIDARRMEVYFTLLHSNLQPVTETAAGILDGSFLSDILAEHQVLFFGNGMPKSRDILSAYPNALFLEELYPLAKYQFQHAQSLFDKRSFEDVSAFEPFYLKDFVITRSKKNPLNMPKRTRP